MFNSFVLNQNNGHETPSSDSSVKKRKRKQVAKACVQCRLNRSKCDDRFPCRSCETRGNTCRRDGQIGARTLEEANKLIFFPRNQSMLTLQREIERLKSKIAELGQLSPPESRASQSTISRDLPHEIFDVTLASQGIGLQDTLSDSVHYHGPASTVAFMHRLSSFLESVLEEPISVSALLPRSEIISNKQLGVGCLRSEQECLLNVFWTSYGCMMPIICETDFREHFRSLWSSSSCRPSSLVDIMMALCIQYSGKFVEDPNKDAGSDWYFHRAQSSLGHEEASISCVQSFIFVTIYFQNLSKQDAAYASIGTAVRMAYSLGLHINPGTHLPESERELRRRIWWGLYVLDTRLSTELGRPWAIERSHVSLPAQETEGSNFKFNGVSYLSFHVQNIKLAVAVRSIFESFAEGVLEYKSPARLEKSATYLNQCMQCLRHWVTQVPESLKLERKDGTSLSNDRAPLIMEDVPLWLQLQRISLELLYHKYASDLYRRFIYFNPHFMTTTPAADAHAQTALNHATTITCIIHQYLSRHDALNGWYDAYNIQFDAALTTMAFTIAYPVCPPAPLARQSVKVAIQSLENFGISNAAKIISGLNSNARTLMDRFRSALNVPAATNQSEFLITPESNTTTFDLDWPDLDYCDMDMWANFLIDWEIVPTSL